MSLMEYMDEKIIGLMNELQDEIARQSKESDADENGLLDLSITINDEIIPFEEKSLFEDRLRILLPETFSIMPSEIAALKYPSEKRPGLIYTNESTSINIAFNYTESPLNDADLDTFKDNMVQVLKHSQPTAQWLEDGVKDMDGQRIGYCDFIVPASDVPVYILVFFVELDGKALLCTFNCTEEEMKEWKPVARGIMSSVKITFGEKGEIDI